jgi:hypothetical protein
MLLLIVLASFLCMAVRSILLPDRVGLLIWPVLLGFGVERWMKGHGVLGGTLGGLLSFVAAGLVLMSGHAPSALDPLLIPVSLVSICAGCCWGFYLSVWVYIMVETVLQRL